MSDDPEPYEVGRRLSRRLERFLFLARLLIAATAQSASEISGATTLVARMNPLMSTFHKGEPVPPENGAADRQRGAGVRRARRLDRRGSNQT
jgi:hypothetical protein